MTRQILSLVTLSVVLLTTSGCASFFVCMTNPDHARLYPGTRADARMIAHPSEDTFLARTKTGRVIFGSVDILPSAAFETVALPIELLPPPKRNPALEPAPAAP